MEIKFKVPIKNVLYMYSYVWDQVKFQKTIQLAAKDDFDALNLLAKLFLLNIRQLIKRGLYREYVNLDETLPLVRGRIHFASTIGHCKLQYGKIDCNYDVFLEDNPSNQILKFTMTKLLGASRLNQELRHELRNIAPYFAHVDYRDIPLQELSSLHYNRQNQHYSLIIKLCELILRASMLSQEQGKFDFDNLFEDKKVLATIFEQFVYKFYLQKLPQQVYQVTHHNKIRFQLYGGEQKFLPEMETDITLKSPLDTVVIDTKFYKDYLGVNTKFENSQAKYHSGNLYQMMCYLNNLDCENDLRGVLLYPKPYNQSNINQLYQTEIISRGQIKLAKLQIVTVDLSVDWPEIDQQLLDVALLG